MPFSAGSSPIGKRPEGATSAYPRASATSFQIPATTWSFVEPSSCTTSSTGFFSSARIASGT
ncbi:MAG: hypothetical protein U1F29_17030 [Planctomycetota bacterium]